MMLGWCLLRQDFRVFRLGRMRDLVRTDETFRPHRVPLLREAMAQIRAQVEQWADSRASTP